MPAVASTSPPVLISHLASITDRISVGSGGVMLPNHSALAVAEQFAMLEALYPGRIDLGLGRAPGTDGRTAVALRRGVRDETADEFPSQLLSLMAMLGDNRTDSDPPLHATPAPNSYPRVMLLGSSTFSAELAGRLGLPFAFAEHFSPEYLDSATEAYRRAFTSSAVLDRPYLIVATSAICAPTDSEAMRLSMPSRMMTVSLRRRDPRPLMTVEDALAHPDAELALELTAGRIAGSPETVRKGLRVLAQNTDANEIMVTTATYDVEDRLESIRLLASGA
jgi:luciferase family oxidoreductase group 1